MAEAAKKTLTIDIDDLFSIEMFRPGYTNKHISQKYLEGIQVVIRHILANAYVAEHEEVRYEKN